MKSFSRSIARGLALLGLFATTAVAQIDSSTHSRSLFTWRDGILAAGFALGTISIRPLDKRAAVALQEPDRQQRRLFQESSTIVRTIAVPGSVVIGVSMYAVGRLSRSERLAAVGLHGTEALFVGEAVASVMKDALGRARPFVDTISPNPDDWQLMRGFHTNDHYRSFPSGHAVAAFAAAAAVSSETSRWWPSATYFGIAPVLYGGAAAVGLSRMYNNRHWASDIIMGAAIGTFAGTKVVRYSVTHPGNRLDRWLLNASISPSDPTHISFSVIPVLSSPTAPRSR